MTPKEKADDLVGRFKIPLIMSDTDAGEEILCTGIAKQCALIAVDIILNDVGARMTGTSYWRHVKSELEAL